MQFNLVAPYEMSPGQEEVVEKLVKNFSSKQAFANKSKFQTSLKIQFFRSRANIKYVHGFSRLDLRFS